MPVDERNRQGSHGKAYELTPLQLLMSPGIYSEILRYDVAPMEVDGQGGFLGYGEDGVPVNCHRSLPDKTQQAVLTGMRVYDPTYGCAGGSTKAFYLPFRRIIDDIETDLTAYDRLMEATRWKYVQHEEVPLRYVFFEYYDSALSEAEIEEVLNLIELPPGTVVSRTEAQLVGRCCNYGDDWISRVEVGDYCSMWIEEFEFRDALKAHLSKAPRGFDWLSRGVYIKVTPSEEEGGDGH